MFSRLWKEGSEGTSDVELVDDRQNQISDDAEVRNGCEAPPDKDQLGPGEGPQQLAEEDFLKLDSGQRRSGSRSLVVYDVLTRNGSSLPARFESPVTQPPII